MEGATIVVKNLGDENLEKAIYESLMAAITEYAGWIISVTGSQDDDNWVVEVKCPFRIKPLVTVLTLQDNKTAQRVVQIVIEQIAVAQAA